MNERDARDQTLMTTAMTTAGERPTDGQPARPAARLPPFTPALAAEFAGTFILVFFGVGAVNAAVATGAQQGLWQVAVVWSLGVSLGIYTAASLSGAHLNPAITVAAAVYEGFPWWRIGPYAVAQTAGAASASLVLYTLFSEAIVEFERRRGLLRGGPGSELSGMMFGEYFPNPAVFGTAEEAWRIVTPATAFLAEMVGTAVLAFLIAALTHEGNPRRPSAGTTPIAIGLTVAGIISVIAPLTQAGLNPARDFGPRLVAYFLGWGEIAIPGPRGGWLSVYILAPLLGALIGWGAHRAIAIKRRDP
ncbi:MAG: MIP/aquaporin family protein [Candidatus Rokuibacteriota bacterium]